LHEIIGAGYWGTGLLVILIVFAMQERTLGRSRTRLLALLIAAPIVAGLLVDAAFGYFIAIRQFLWALPALALICAPALEAGGMKPLFVASLFAVVSAFQSYKYFADRSEDWHAAAILAEKEIGSEGCFLSAPPNHLRYYSFETPGLESKACGAH